MQENAQLKAVVDKLKAENTKLKATYKSDAFYEALGDQVANVLAHIGGLPTLSQLAKPQTTKELKRSVEDRDIAKTTVLVLGLLSDSIALEQERYFEFCSQDLDENEFDKATNTSVAASTHIKVGNYTPRQRTSALSIGQSPQYKDRRPEEPDVSFEDYLNPCGLLSEKESFVSGDDDYMRLMGESEEMLTTIHAQSQRIARLNQEICSTMQSSKRLLALKEKPKVPLNARRSAAELLSPITPTSKARRSIQ